MFMLFNAGLHWWLAAFCGDCEVIKFGINSAHTPGCWTLRLILQKCGHFLGAALFQFFGETEVSLHRSAPDQQEVKT